MWKSSNREDEELQSGEHEKLSLDEVLDRHASVLKRLKDEVELEDVILYRFLKGHCFHAETTKRILEETRGFRESSEHAVKARQEIPSIENYCDLPHFHTVSQFFPHAVFHGTARDHSPLVIERIGSFDASGMDKVLSEEQILEYVIYNLEFKYHRLNQLSRYHNKFIAAVVIVDLSGVSLRNVTNRTFLKFVKSVSSIGQTHYPETAKKIFFLNAPATFNLLWRVVKHFLNERTQSKIIVCGTNFEALLAADVDKDQLPEFLKGTCNCAADSTTEEGMKNPHCILDVKQHPSRASRDQNKEN